MYRSFVDHAGRRHRVRMTDEEISERWKFRACFAGSMMIFSAALVIASGIF